MNEFEMDMVELLEALGKLLLEEIFNQLSDTSKLHIQAYDSDCRTHGFSGAVYQNEEAIRSEVNIESAPEFSGGREGHLSSEIPVSQIVAILGEPNVDDDPDKVNYSWAYRVNGKEVAIWDYKGSRWSYCGDTDTLKQLFGEEVVYSER